MSDRILDQLVNKRAIIGFVTPRGNVEMTVARILGVDEKFLQVRTDPENSEDPRVISKGVVTYLSLNSVDSIVDASDDEVYTRLMASFKRQQEQVKAQQMAMRQQQQQPPVPSAEPTQEKEDGEKEESS